MPMNAYREVYPSPGAAAAAFRTREIREKKRYSLSNARTYFLVAKHIDNRSRLASRGRVQRVLVRSAYETPRRGGEQSWACTLSLVSMGEQCFITDAGMGVGSPRKSGSCNVSVHKRLEQGGALSCAVCNKRSTTSNGCRDRSVVTDGGRVSVDSLGGLQDGTIVQAHLSRLAAVWTVIACLSSSSLRA